MSSRAVSLDPTDQPVFGAPRVLPVVLLCHATVEWCGQLWVANTEAEYAQSLHGRSQHEKSCEAIQELRKSAPREMKLLRI